MTRTKQSLFLATALLVGVGCGAPDEGSPSPSAAPATETPAPTPAPTETPVPTPVDADGDGSRADVDCNDSDPDINPDADELCDTIDNDCSGVADDNPVEGDTYFSDADLDGFGASTDVGALFCADPGEGFSAQAGDCDDAAAAVNPDGVEICDGIDNDCDALVDFADDDLPGSEVFYVDTDGDGWGDGLQPTTTTCTPGYASQAGDCNDGDAAVNPGVDEIWGNGTDEDCDGQSPNANVFVDKEGVAPVEGAPVFTTIQAAINAAFGGQTIAVERGTYSETISFNGKNLVLISMRGPEQTVINGGARGSVVSFIQSEGPSARLEGFTLRGGNGTDGSICGFSLGFNYGGGICISGASPTIVGNIVEDNEVDGSGGGIYAEQGDPTFINNVVRNNSADYDGGGLNLTQMGGSVAGSLIEGNYAGRSGGGLVVNSTTTQFTNNVITANQADANTLPGVDVGDIGGAGAILSALDASTWKNNVVSHNLSDGDGGGFYVALDDEAGPVNFVNNTIVGNNSPGSDGGGLYVLSGEVILKSNIVAFNQAPTGANLMTFDSATIITVYGDFYSPGGSVGVTGLTLDPSNLTSDPQLVDDPTDLVSTDDDYHLKATSPCIDAGDSDPASNDPDGSRNDIGAYGGPGAALW